MFCGFGLFGFNTLYSGKKAEICANSMKLVKDLIGILNQEEADGIRFLEGSQDYDCHTRN